MDATHLRIGIDHWGVGARESDAIEVSADKPHRLEVWSATFLPPEGNPAWGQVPVAEQRRLLGSIRVELDGKRLLEVPWKGYAASPDQITIGSNELGGSTASAAFSGRIREVTRQLP